jgi:arsenate reductase
MKLKIYHNNRCSKSRQCLALIPSEKVEIINYLETPLNKEELASLIQKIGINPSELIRKGETIWKENYKGKDLSEEDCLNAMVHHPKLMERPIVESGNKAIVCRPPELVNSFL